MYGEIHTILPLYTYEFCLLSKRLFEDIMHHRKDSVNSCAIKDHGQSHQMQHVPGIRTIIGLLHVGSNRQFAYKKVYQEEKNPSQVRPCNDRRTVGEKTQIVGKTTREM